MSEPGRSDVERMRSLVAEGFGLAFEDGKLDFLGEVLRDRLRDLGHDGSDAYFVRLTGPTPWREEWRALAERLTVSETYFYRYEEHFKAFADVVLPRTLQRVAPSQEIRILSAGCSSGEEAYTLAMLVEARTEGRRPAQVVGIDVNPAMIARARRARYSPWSLRETPGDARARYFREDGKEFALEGRLRSRVTFEERNLLDEDPAFWQPGSFDAIFCRNVIMYFTPAAAKSVVARLGRSLKEGGYLFLGHAETLRGISDEFHLCQSHETFYYQRRGRPAAAVDEAPPGFEPSSVSWTPAAPDTTWVDVIQKASDRIAALTKEPRSAGAAPGSAPSCDLGEALELLRREHFVEALDLISGLPPECRAEAEVLLLQAVLLTNSGKIVEAEAACLRLLDKDELNAGAHYLRALCREHAGDLRAAADCDKTAAYLDPAFAMPRLHLALLARRGGDRARARSELERALDLLGREDGSRILLFGGGFSRESLAALCRSEIAACGGSS